MKTVTEFTKFALNQGLKTKSDLLAAGKNAEEIQQSLGEAFKIEGDKLKHFTNALEVAGQNTENLKRVVILSLNEGENAPAKALKVEDFHYVPEFLIDIKSRVAPSTDRKGGRRDGRGGGGPKESPWGLSPEQKAAKNGPKKS